MTENTTASGAADRYTKKPVTIDAIRWTGKNLREVIAFTDGPPDTRTSHAGMAWDTYVDLVERDGLKIFTLEGKMSAAIGDWIIKGVQGEMYPCKDEIFEATYSPALAASAPVAPAPQAQADARDAERWRAATRNMEINDVAVVIYDQLGDDRTVTGDEADAAIDAAIAAAKHL